MDQDGKLKGLITIKDIEKAVQYPNSARDDDGRLLCGAAIGATKDVLDRVAALVEAQVDVVVLDSAHGHNSGILERREAGKESIPGASAHRGQRRHGGGHKSAHRRGCGLREGRHGPGLHLHDAHCRRHRRAAGHRDL